MSFCNLPVGPCGSSWQTRSRPAATTSAHDRAGARATPRAIPLHRCPAPRSGTAAPAIVDGGWRRLRPPAQRDSRVAASSSAWELIHSPPDLMTSLARSTICSVLSGSITAMSPVRIQPSLVCKSCSDCGNTRRQSSDRDIADVRALAVARSGVSVIVHHADLIAIERLALRRIVSTAAAYGRSSRANEIVAPCVVSVIPQPWLTRMSCSGGIPRSSPTVRRAAGKHATQPAETDGRSAGNDPNAEPDRRHRRGDGDAFLNYQPVQPFAVGATAGQHESAPYIGARKGTAQPLQWKNPGMPRTLVVGRQAPSRCRRRWRAPTARYRDANTARPSVGRSCRR